MTNSDKQVDEAMHQILLRLWLHLSLRRRSQFGLLIVLTLISSISEMISIGSALPFIAILTDSDKVFSYPILADLAHWLGVQSPKNLIFILAVFFASATLVAGILRLLLLWASIRFGNATGTDLGIDIYRKTLYQPYSTHVLRNSSEVISGMIQKVSAATGVIISAVTFITNLALFLAIMFSLLLIDPGVSIAAALCFGAAYWLIALSTRPRLIRNSKVLAQKQTEVTRSLQEGLGAIRDVLLEGTQEHYSDIYRLAALRLQQANTENSFISQAPRYGLETLAMLLVALFVLVVSSHSNSLTNILPILGVLALGAQRLLPLMQQIFGNWSVVTGSKAVLVDVITLLDQPLPKTSRQPGPPALKFKDAIKLNNLSFRYGKDCSWVLSQINLVIPKGARIGIIGATGSGKSTALDIIMGLLEPTQGELLVDGQVINHINRRSWQRCIAHVPQMIFLADLSIAENIAFGIPRDQIDYCRVREAAEMAKAHEFIERTSEGYDTFVGERGARLSGGQRQRIGIARALYKQASVLCFDEATSALDNSTENDVMQSIDNIDKNITVLIIAHRLTTLKNCTHIIKLENGKIQRITSYSNVELEYE